MFICSIICHSTHIPYSTVVGLVAVFMRHISIFIYLFRVTGKTRMQKSNVCSFVLYTPKIHASRVFVRYRRMNSCRALSLQIIADALSHLMVETETDRHINNNEK